MFQEKERSSTIWTANYFSLAPVISNPGTATTTLHTHDDDGNFTGVGSQYNMMAAAAEIERREKQPAARRG
jgi:hypothetical protein